MDEFKPTVLVVDDEKAILLGLEETLKSEGYKVITAADGPTALALAIEYTPDLVLLDIMLPALSGYEVCRKMRAEGIQSPVIMLTARGDEFDKLHGFEVGADDYVVKPFSLGELLARVKAVLARGERRGDTPRTYGFGRCLLDMDARTLAVAGESVTCTRTEFDLLAYFCRYPGKALSREILMRDVWGTEYYGTQRSLDSFVATLRKKVEVDAHAPLHIRTVHGVGYKFDPDAAD